MMSRRDFSMSLAPGMAVLTLAGCTNGQVDPQKVVDVVKTACAIAVPAAVVASIIATLRAASAARQEAGATAPTVQAIVDLICSAYHSSLQARKLGAPAAGSTVEFVVVVSGKEIPVTAVVQ